MGTLTLFLLWISAAQACILATTFFYSIPAGCSRIFFTQYFNDTQFVLSIYRSPNALTHLYFPFADLAEQYRSTPLFSSTFELAGINSTTTDIEIPLCTVTMSTNCLFPEILYHAYSFNASNVLMGVHAMFAPTMASYGVILASTSVTEASIQVQLQLPIQDNNACVVKRSLYTFYKNFGNVDEV